MARFSGKFFGRIWLIFKKWALKFGVGFIFAVLCFVAINAAMEPVSTSKYCGTTCHEMANAYESWKLSPHGTNSKGLRAECIDCHLPPKDKFFTHITAKAYTGAKDIYKHHFGKYDEEEVREKVLEHFSNGMCLRCHVDLLAKPLDEMVKEAHTEALKPVEQTRCIDCHEGIAHQR